MQSTVPADSSGRLIAVTSSTRSTPGPGPHVAADVLSPGKQRAKVGVTLPGRRPGTTPNSKTGPGQSNCLGHQAAERLVVVAHRRGSSLSQAGREGKMVAGNVRRPHRPLPPTGFGADHRPTAQNRSRRSARPRMRSTAAAITGANAASVPAGVCQTRGPARRCVRGSSRFPLRARRDDRACRARRECGRPR